jgi:imidazolonepropionase-like amidohydrolase
MGIDANPGAANRVSQRRPHAELRNRKGHGTIEKGKFADITAVSGNPLADVSEMDRVHFVMKGGTVIRNDFAGR